MTTSTLTIAANRGELGGGEVMLLQLAAAARDLGLATWVVAPAAPGDLADAARQQGHEVVALPCRDRRGYARALRRWDARERRGLLWCNGLLPAVATTGHRDRVVHLHQTPTGAQRWAAYLAGVGARAVVVPSADMGRRVKHDVVLPNWTEELPRLARSGTDRRVVGYLGRLQTDKGVDVLAAAVQRLLDDGLDVELVLAGDAGFGDAADRRRIDDALAPLGDRAVRTGRIDRRDFFERVDLAVFPSVWPEPFGLVVAEAMGYGVPFVVSDAGALPEVSGPDHPWVARAGDADDLARVVRTALTGEPTTVQGVVDRARERWEREYSPAAGRDRLAEVLRGLGMPVAVPEVRR